MNEERGPWYLLTGLVIGLLLGLFYAWIAQPVEYVETTPGSLRADFKDQYRALIASAYMSNQDLVRAQARLELLEDEDILRAIAEQAQRKLAQDGASQEARALGILAIALGQGGAPAEPIQNPPTQILTTTATLAATFTQTPEPTATATHTPTASPTPTASATATQPLSTAISQTPTPENSPTPDGESTPTETPIPRPTDTPTFTPTPTLTPGAPFVLVDSQKVCEQELVQPLIQVFAEAANGQPLPGVLVIVTWEGGEERFYTGLKPEKGAGYADFTPVPGEIYTLHLGEAGETASGLGAVQCTRPGGDDYWGYWLLKFVQP
ncbi:hypothetical protein ACFLZW_06340 [Chloroflexota bacterium]